MNDISQNYESSGSHSDCEVIVPLLDCYHDNEIDDAERLEVDRHLANCPACNKELANISSLVKKLATLTPVRAEIDFADLVEKQILAEQSLPASSVSNVSNKQSQNVVPISGTKKWLAAVAAVVVLALIALQMTSTAHHSVSVASGDLPEVQSIETQGSSDKASDLQEQVKMAKPTELNKITPAHSNRIRTANVKVAEFDGAIDVNQKQNLVAITNPVQDNIAEELGITTDEDGLYAIKM